MDLASTLGTVHAAYLGSAACLAAIPTLPTVAAVKRVAESEATTTEFERPSIVVTVDLEDSEQTRGQKFANIKASLKVTTGAETGQTTDAQARAWLSSIQTALMKQSAWKTFILTLPLDERTGWRIADRWQLPPETDRDAEKGTLDLTAVVRLRLAVAASD